MNWRTRIISVGFAAVASALLAQETPTTSATQSTTTTTTRNADGSTTTSTVTGEVVRYEPGKTIVVRDENGTVTYTIESGIDVPADVQVGRKVTLYTQPGDNAVRVRRITSVTGTDASGATSTTTEVRDAAGSTMNSQAQAQAQAQTTRQTQTTTTDTARPPADRQMKQTQTTTQTTTRATNVSGTVRAYEPGQSITVVGPDNKTTTYTITTDSQLPQDIAIGKRVTVQTTVVAGKPVVRSVTSKTTTTTRTTHTKDVTPQ
ncbi:MAG: hypothetical protein ABI592_02980 [Acidobacteriota bacterium]